MHLDLRLSNCPSIQSRFEPSPCELGLLVFSACPVGLPANIFDIVQSPSHPDCSVTDQSGIETQYSLDSVLCFCRGVVSHEEIMAGVVQGAMFS